MNGSARPVPVARKASPTHPPRLTTLAHLPYHVISNQTFGAVPRRASSRPNVNYHVCLVWNINMIKVEGLTKRYARTVAVDDISFEVEKGQIVGFLGPNGAGKTTTMRVLTCFLPPTSGTATVAGFDVLENPQEVKKRIGYLPETPPLYPEMEVIEYLT